MAFGIIPAYHDLVGGAVEVIALVEYVGAV
jgi:hypothetical protein